VCTGENRSCARARGLLADILSQNSLDGVESHGWNRFLTLIKQIEQGVVKIDAEPERIAAFQAGNSGTVN
jgi:LDH2 family malate/lactate/ureidoglycolate dehydrogenase